MKGYFDVGFDEGSSKGVEDLEELCAWVSVDENGLEGVIAISTGDMPTQPMVGSDIKRLETWREVIEELKEKRPTVKYQLCQFDNKTVLEEI